jgi:hypothetical protein
VQKRLGERWLHRVQKCEGVAAQRLALTDRIAARPILTPRVHVCRNSLRITATDARGFG